MPRKMSLQVEWLMRIADRPVWYQEIPLRVRNALRKRGWATCASYGIQLCYIITDAGRKALEEAQKS